MGAKKEALALTVAGASGATLIALGLWLDARPMRLYGTYDFWHTSPNFFLVRAGIVIVILFLAYAWCRWGAGEWGFSPLIEMGKCSLLVYWVHIEFVYGGLSIVPKHRVGIGTATLGLIAIFVAMTVLAMIRNRFPKWKPQMVGVVSGCGADFFIADGCCSRTGEQLKNLGFVHFSEVWPCGDLRNVTGTIRIIEFIFAFVRRAWPCRGA